MIALYVFLLKLNTAGLPVIGNPLILPLIYTAGAIPFQTWRIKNYFDSMPRSLDEAAFIDGANYILGRFRCQNLTLRYPSHIIMCILPEIHRRSNEVRSRKALNSVTSLTQ